MTNLGLETQSTFALKTFDSIQTSALKSWVRSCVRRIDANNIFQMQFLLERTRLVSVPSESWNLRLVNIQKSIKNFTWDVSVEALRRKTCHNQGVPAPSNLLNDFGGTEASTPVLFRAYGNSRTPRTPHFNDQAHDQGKFCKSWLRATGLKFYDTPPPNILPSTVQKEVGSDPCLAESILCYSDLSRSE